jgi:hypothetical protein
VWQAKHVVRRIRASPGSSTSSPVSGGLRRAATRLIGRPHRNPLPVDLSLGGAAVFRIVDGDAIAHRLPPIEEAAVHRPLEAQPRRIVANTNHQLRPG